MPVERHRMPPISPYFQGQPPESCITEGKVLLTDSVMKSFRDRQNDDASDISFGRTDDWSIPNDVDQIIEDGMMSKILTARGRNTTGMPVVDRGKLKIDRSNTTMDPVKNVFESKTTAASFSKSTTDSNAGGYNYESPDQGVFAVIAQDSPSPIFRQQNEEWQQGGRVYNYATYLNMPSSNRLTTPTITQQRGERQIYFNIPSTNQHGGDEQHHEEIGNQPFHKQNHGEIHSFRPASRRISASIERVLMQSSTESVQHLARASENREKLGNLCDKLIASLEGFSNKFQKKEEESKVTHEESSSSSCAETESATVVTTEIPRASVPEQKVRHTHFQKSMMYVCFRVWARCCKSKRQQLRSPAEVPSVTSSPNRFLPDFSVPRLFRERYMKTRALLLWKQEIVKKLHVIDDFKEACNSSPYKIHVKNCDSGRRIQTNVTSVSPRRRGGGQRGDSPAEYAAPEPSDTTPGFRARSPGLCALPRDSSNSRYPTRTKSPARARSVDNLLTLDSRAQRSLGVGRRTMEETGGRTVEGIAGRRAEPLVYKAPVPKLLPKRLDLDRPPWNVFCKDDGRPSSAQIMAERALKRRTSLNTSRDFSLTNKAAHPLYIPGQTHINPLNLIRSNLKVDTGHPGIRERNMWGYYRSTSQPPRKPFSTRRTGPSSAQRDVQTSNNVPHNASATRMQSNNSIRSQYRQLTPVDANKTNFAVANHLLSADKKNMTGRGQSFEHNTTAAMGNAERNSSCVSTPVGANEASLSSLLRRIGNSASSAGWPPARSMKGTMSAGTLVPPASLPREQSNSPISDTPVNGDSSFVMGVSSTAVLKSNAPVRDDIPNRPREMESSAIAEIHFMNKLAICHYGKTKQKILFQCFNAWRDDYVELGIKRLRQMHKTLQTWNDFLNRQNKQLKGELNNVRQNMI